MKIFLRTAFVCLSLASTTRREVAVGPNEGLQKKEQSIVNFFLSALAGPNSAVVRLSIPGNRSESRNRLKTYRSTTLLTDRDGQVLQRGEEFLCITVTFCIVQLCYITFDYTTKEMINAYYKCRMTIRYPKFEHTKRKNDPS